MIGIAGRRLALIKRLSHARDRLRQRPPAVGRSIERSNCRGHVLERQLGFRADRSRLKNFIEEIIRLETPVQSLFRIARKESVLRGVTIPRNAIIDMRFGAANRDPEAFEKPNEMDLHRKGPGRHMAYGTAHHHCIGAPLARQEMTLAFSSLLDRMADIQLAPGKNDFQHHPHFALRGLKALHLTFRKA